MSIGEDYYYYYYYYFYVLVKIPRVKSEEIKTKNLEELEVPIVDSFETFVQQNCVVALQRHG